ncbi:hypothetical protein LZ31DRAFT_561161 [Colletotrichum somersetense]|nr:hypothetical protein LZ31DRAFT_561161 [Colletotrichum somersetense]
METLSGPTGHTVQLSGSDTRPYSSIVAPCLSVEAGGSQPTHEYIQAVTTYPRREVFTTS